MPLVELGSEHLELVLNWRNDPAVRNNMFRAAVISWDEHVAWYERVKKDTTAHWFLHLSSSGSPDGVASFIHHRQEHRHAYWGFYKNPATRPGTGTQLGLEALDLAFGELGLHKLSAEVLSTNTVSQRFHEKLGFEQEGRCRERHLAGGVFLDVLLYGILEEEWTARRDLIARRLDARPYD